MDLILPHPKFLNKEHLGNSFVYSGRFYQKCDWERLLLFNSLNQFHLVSPLTRINYEVNLKVYKGVCRLLKQTDSD